MDSNGYLYFNGGTVVVDGPTNNGNGALDSGMGVVFNGGSLVAVGASGMVEAPAATSGANSVNVYFAATQAKGTKVEIKNSAGETVVQHTSAKTFASMVAGSSKFITGETYTIYINDEKYQDFTIENVTTTVGNTNANYQNMNAAGQGAMPGQRR